METSSYHLPRSEAGNLSSMLYSQPMNFFTINLMLGLIFTGASLTPASLSAQDAQEAIQVSFETSQGPVMCNLVSKADGEADLVNCTFEDGTALTDEQIVELGLKPEEAASSD